MVSFVSDAFFRCIPSNKMPLFYIDTIKGCEETRDEYGETYRDIIEARQATILALPGLCDSDLPDGETQHYKAVLRDETRKVLYTATLTFCGTWKAEV